MTEPLVSVHMITYNHAPYISQAIEGVLMQQTRFPFELVIGEDCSTDGTREIVLDYARRFPDIIRVITSDRNLGATGNVERTLQACRGKYIAWCEGDDYWHRDDKLQIQIEYLEANHDCGLVSSDYDWYQVQTGKRIVCYNRYQGKKPPENPQLRDLLHGKCGILTCTTCARLEMVREIRELDPEVYSSSRFLMGDTQLWADILSRARVHYFDTSLATHNILPESASQSQSAVKRQRFHVSNAEMRVYMAAKYGLAHSEMELYKNHLSDAKLFLAFLDHDKQMGSGAWCELSDRTVRQRMLFWGSQSWVLNRILTAIWYCKRHLGMLGLLPGSTGSRKTKCAGRGSVA